MPTYLDRTSLTGLDSPSLLWTSSHPTRLSAVRCRLATRVTLRQLPSSRSFVQLSDRRSLPTSGHAEISSPKPFVWFHAKTDKESSAWRTTYIVWHKDLIWTVAYSGNIFSGVKIWIRKRWICYILLFYVMSWSLDCEENSSARTEKKVS